MRFTAKGAKDAKVDEESKEAANYTDQRENGTNKNDQVSISKYGNLSCRCELILNNTHFKTLPDYLAPGLDLVFIGINPGLYSVEKGHYFARTTSRFWPAFSASKLSEPVRKGLNVSVLGPAHDVELLRFGIGLTDTVKRPTANAAGLTRSDFETWIPVLLQKLQNYQPRIACFHGTTAYRPFLEFALQSPGGKPVLGEQVQTIGATRLFVVPNPSPANAHFTVRDQALWYDNLDRLLVQLNSRSVR